MKTFIRLLFCAVAVFVFALTNQTPAQAQNRIEDRFANVNGVRLHYLIAGKGDPLILLHGYAQTSRMWRPLMVEPSRTHTGCVALDAQGFIKTGSDLSPEELAAARWPLARPPFLLETSLPGVFAVGDVRGGNIKRVASAVGEGSIAVALVHQVLNE